MIKTIAFDADDTLWQNEVNYVFTQEMFASLLAPYCHPEMVDSQLYETEMRNLRLFGYGTKAFMLSMIETAIELTDGRINGGEIQQIINAGKSMLEKEIELLPHVPETLRTLHDAYPLMLITKGDLLDQESKISRSGLSDYFNHIEIVSDKSAQTYQSLLDKYRIEPQHFLMAGNSLKSDVLPLVEIGATAVHVPFEITWAHEANIDPQHDQASYYTIEHLGQLPDLLKTL